MLKMFVDVGVKNNFITSSMVSLPMAQSDSDFDRAEIVVRIDSKKELSDADFNLTKTAKGKLAAGSNHSSLVDFNLTKQQSSTLKKTDVKKVAREVTQSHVDDIYAKLTQAQLRSQEVDDKISQAYTCEDSKLLELLMEHILLHWDDIMACLVDELI